MKPQVRTACRRVQRSQPAESPRWMAFLARVKGPGRGPAPVGRSRFVGFLMVRYPLQQRSSLGAVSWLPLAFAVLGVASGKDAGHIIQDIGGADFAVAHVADETALDDVNLLLGLAVDHGTDQRA